MIRLLRLDACGGLSLETFEDGKTPRYAILSHTWGEEGDEVTFKDLKTEIYKSKAGYDKILFCCKQAEQDELQYSWVDTCCINKRSSEELREAITSMFHWYCHAAKCYVYLSDVSYRKPKSQRTRAQQPIWETAFRNSKWFTRGWTLQELLAPTSVEFFSKEHERLGDKATLKQQIHQITSIPITALDGRHLSHFPILERLRWAAERSTKRKEDKAYCLLGICEVSMIANYGEGEDLALARLKEQIDRRSKIDAAVLDRLPCAKGAMFNSIDQEDHTTCHPATRIDVLRQIHDWAQQPNSKSIFWLCGMAGIGKSTISWSFAKWLTDQGCHGAVDLGASFFFKRGEGDRRNASRFFSTIVRDLILKIPRLDRVVAEVIDSDPTICDKALGEQFEKLIFQPLQKLTSYECPSLVVVVDALDECEKENDIRIILQLWTRLSRITTIRIKLFLTSRPELPIRLEFNKMADDIYRDMLLHNEAEVPLSVIQQDICTFLTDRFSQIKANYNADLISDAPLDADWPGEKTLEILAGQAVPLFIVAATICRFVEDPDESPPGRLENILRRETLTGHLKPMENLYLIVLKQMSARWNGEDKLFQEFRQVVGSIVALAEPVSVTSLAALLEIPRDNIMLRLRPLHSVLRIPGDFNSPVRPLHLSFSEFLLSGKLQTQHFGIDSPATHLMLLTRCLKLMSGSHGLRENMCGFRYPGQPRKELDSNVITQHLSSALQYACQYWVLHAKQSGVQLADNTEVHVFLKKHFLHWLEALSLMNRLAEVVRYLGVLQKLTSKNKSTQISSFLQDALRIVLASRSIVDLAPLQIYSSAMLFAPRESIVRKTLGQIPTWIQKCPTTPALWGLELQTLEGHSSSVRAVAFSPDGARLASGSDDKTVRLWDTITGQELQKLRGHSSSVRAVAFSPDGARLASGSYDNTVRLWDTVTGQELQKLKGHSSWVRAVAFSPDGARLASGSDDTTVRLWDTVTGQELQKLKGHSSSVSAVAFSPDGARLASGSYDKTVRLWDTVTGQELQKLKGHSSWVSAIAFSPDGARLASGSDDTTVRLWDAPTGQELQKLKGHSSSVRAVAFSPDSARLASGSFDDTVRLWDTVTGQELQKLKGHSSSVSAVAFSPDSARLASGSFDDTVRLWDTVTGQELQKLKGHSSWVRAVAFSPDGARLASGSDDKTVRLWDTVTGQELQKLEGHSSSVSAVAFSPDSARLASGSFDDTVRLWDTVTGQELQKLKGHSSWVRAVAFSPDGARLASGSDDNTVRLWDTVTGQELQKLEGHYSWVSAVAFSPDSARLASGSFDKTVRLWDTITGQELQKLRGHSSSVSAVTFSPDGARLASGSYDKTVRLWDTVTGQELQKLKGHSSWVSAIAFSPDGARLASGSDDTTVRLWDAPTGQELHRFDDMIRVSSIEFVNASTIMTNRGALFVRDQSRLAGLDCALTSQHSVIKGEWIQQAGHNLLWLPHNYRNAVSAYRDNTFGFGFGSGQVDLIRLYQYRAVS